MLVTVSPAKRLKWDAVDIPTTELLFREDIAQLLEVVRALTAADLEKLMKLSPKLAQLNYERFRDYAMEPTPDLLRPAMFGFDGDTYAGLEARSLEPDERAYAQDHLRILSGFYGVLRPLDGIQPYRLEMGTRLANARGKNLYAFWGDRIARMLNAHANDIGADILVNCASNEYFDAVDQSVLTPKVVTPVFMEMKNGMPKIVSFYAKKARGAMARFIIQRRVTDLDGLRDFDTGGYQFQADQSDDSRLVFLRDA